MKKNRDNILKSIKTSFCELFFTYTFATSFLSALMLSFVIFIADYYNFPSRIIDLTPKPVLWTTIGLVASIIVMLFLQNHIFDLFCIFSINPIDNVSITLIISTCLYALLRMSILGRCLYTSIASVICLLLFILLTKRFIVRCIKLFQSKKRTSNLIDLRDLYESNIPFEFSKPILVAEKDVDYDLLERSGIINQLYNSIIHCQPEQSYVISLEGAWGTGKTTIINCTKKLLKNNKNSSKNYVITDNFDPWLFETQEALLLAMLETLIHQSGMRYSPAKSQKIARGFQEALAGSHWAGTLLQNLLQNPSENRDRIAELKNKISSYLRISNKTIVFFIDNLDRANSNNIIFLFKLISIVFDLPGVIYVLSFERERIDRILEKTQELDSRFIEKIIQQEIKVPPVGEEQSQTLYSACIEKLLLAHGVSKTEIKDFIPSAKYIINKTSNLRVFKRMINTVFPVVFGENTILKTSDLFSIEAIHFYNPNLFSTIYHNSKFFISHDKNPTIALKVGANKKEFNRESVEFFRTHLSDCEDELELLKELFPYVKRYMTNMDLEQDTMFTDSEYKKIIAELRICSGKFFDLYFTRSTNNHLTIQNDIKAMIDDIYNIKSPNDDSGLEECARILRRHLFKVGDDAHNEWFELLQFQVASLNKEYVYCVAVSIYALIYLIANKKYFFAFDARTRAIYILSELLLVCTDEEYENFIEIIKQDYKCLNIISNIHYWLSSDNQGQNQTHQIRTEKLYTRYSEICKSITEKNINLYSNKYYYPKNIWGLYRYFDKCNNLEEFTSYIHQNLTNESIYRVLWDTTTMSIGSGCTYSIAEESFNVFIGDTAVVDKLLSEFPPKNEDEKFVFDIYDDFQNGKPNVLGEKGIFLPNEKKPIL